MNRLCPATLGDVKPDVLLPGYDRGALRAGIVHLGLGAFHRAHQAVYTDIAMAGGDTDWGIVGATMRSADVAARLRPQGGLYSVLSEDPGQASLRVVGAVQDVHVAADDPAPVAAVIANPSIRIVTLTVTEKGYCLAADGQSLDRDDPVICSDLRNPLAPRSAIGVLALGLRERLAAGGAALTVLSCDNLSQNSARLRAVLGEYLASSFPQVLPWLQGDVAFPCSVVDRIVPALTAAQRERQVQLLGLRDEAAVSTEPFSQWIIEDRFAAGRPRWECAGAQYVDNIDPFEQIKLRLLNASHSAIACLGLIAGKETVDRVMADAQLGGFVGRLLAEDLAAALPAAAGFDLVAYREALLARFANPALQHRCAQIATDSSEKIGQRWLPALQATHAPLLRRMLAVWCYWLLYTDIGIDDPRRERLLEQRASDAPAAQRVRAVLSCARISAASVGDFETLATETQRNMDTLARDGLAALLAA